MDSGIREVLSIPSLQDPDVTNWRAQSILNADNKSEIQREYSYGPFGPMSSMKDYICRTWDLNRSEDFFAPPLPPLPRHRNADPWLAFALFSLAKATSSVDTARNAVSRATRRGGYGRRRRGTDEITARVVEEARDYVVSNMGPDALERYKAGAESRRRDEERWNKEKETYEWRYEDNLRRREREGSGDRRRSRFRSPVGRSPSRYRQRSRSRPRPHDCERRAPSVNRRSSPPPHPSLQRDRPVDQPAYFGAATNQFSEYAIETPNLVNDPPGATFDERLGLREEAVQLLGVQEEYYEAVRRKMLARYMARVQMYEKKVIQIWKRVADGEGTRYERGDGRRGRGDKGRERETRDGRRRYDDR